MLFLSICRCLYANALPFNLMDPFFKIMLESIASFDKGLKSPSYHEVRVTFKKKIEIINRDLIESYKVEWKKIGCTLMSNGWIDGKNRSITNFLVYSPRKTIFLKVLILQTLQKC